MILTMSRIQSKITWHIKNQKYLNPYRERKSTESVSNSDKNFQVVTIKML